MSSPHPFSVRSTTEDDWREVRGLRLEALADTPLAFGEHLADAERHGEAAWRERGGRGTRHQSALFAAIDDETRRWVGTMGGFLHAPGHPLLVGVYVTPDRRGARAGVTDALLDAVEGWAITWGDHLYLEVHSENPRAIAYYRRRGYEPTGRTQRYVLDPDQTELEMRRLLR